MAPIRADHVVSNVHLAVMEMVNVQVATPALLLTLAQMYALARHPSTDWLPHLLVQHVPLTALPVRKTLVCAQLALTTLL